MVVVSLGIVVSPSTIVQAIVIYQPDIRSTVLDIDWFMTRNGPQADTPPSAVFGIL